MALGQLLLLFAFVVSIHAQTTCYYPDHSTKSVDVPCNTTAEFSACCGSKALCIGNGLCWDEGVISRGSCTDSTWDAPECNQQCKNANPSGGSVVIPCDWSSSPNTFACGFGDNICDDQANVFDMTGLNNITLKASQLSSAIAAVGTDASPSQSSVLSSIANPTADTAATPSTSSESSSTSNGVSIGALVGTIIGIAVPLLIAIGALLFLLRREKGKNAALSSNLPPSNGTYGAPAQQYGEAPMAQGYSSSAADSPGVPGVQAGPWNGTYAKRADAGVHAMELDASNTVNELENNKVAYYKP